jgi:hypothetical protein
MPITLNRNILFRFSGVNLGEYIFPQNPMAMSIFSPKQELTILPILVGENIYQRALLDNNIRSMSWSETTTDIYTSLRRFSERDSLGNIPTTYFWDGTVKEFQGTAIQVIDVYGKPIIAKSGAWEVELQFKPITNFDKEYKVI